QQLPRRIPGGAGGSVEDGPAEAVAEVCVVEQTQEVGQGGGAGGGGAQRQGQHVEVGQGGAEQHGVAGHAGVAQPQAVGVGRQVQGGDDAAERVGVHEQRRGAAAGGGGGQVDRHGRPADAPLLAGDQQL